MIKGIMLLGDGFEQVEALATQDVLNRTREINTELVSISESNIVTSSSGIKIIASKIYTEINKNDYDFVILPGGKVGVDNLKKSSFTIDVIKTFIKEGKYVFAICAAPSLLCENGLLNNKNFVCFPGFESGTGNYVDQGVVKDGKIITGRSMGYSIPFGEEIVKTLLGEEALKRISVGIYGLK